MYHLLGLEQNLKTILLLAQSTTPAPICTMGALKERYVGLLASLQPSVPTAEMRPIEYVTDSARVAQLSKIFNVDSALNDIEHKILAENTDLTDSLHLRQAATATVQQHVTQLAARYPEWSQLLTLAVNLVFCARSETAGGGTTSAAIGVIWCDFRPSWGEDDFLEFFTHELTHTLMFLDERRYQHYVELREILRPENYAQSAILTVRRPLDKVLHSLVVATEVLLLRDQFLGHPENPKVHPPTPTMLEKSLQTIADIRAFSNLQALLAPRGLALIDRCAGALKHVAHHLQGMPEDTHAVA